MVLESTDGGRNKKLAMALEAHERHGQLNCNTCSDKLRLLRGCKKPGMDIKGSQAFRFASPNIPVEKSVVFECPVGVILREFPFAYETINACSFVDRAGIDGLNIPQFLREAHTIVSAEKMRLDKLREQDRQTSKDANYAKQVLRSKNG